MYYISYSLFGSDHRYLDGLLQCIEANSVLYPRWKNIVYYDENISQKWIKRLKQQPIEMEPRVASTQWDGLYWRFEIFDRSDCECALIRDTDSITTPRERDLVMDWLSSDKKIHIIRDHPEHKWPINAGMWGGRGLFPFKFENEISTWKWKFAKCGDQHLLRRVVYRKYYRESLVHTSYVGFKGESIDWIEPALHYIGRRYFDPVETIPKTQRSIQKRKNLGYEFRLEIDFYRRQLKRALLKNISSKRICCM